MSTSFVIFRVLFIATLKSNLHICYISVYTMHIFIIAPGIIFRTNREKVSLPLLFFEPIFENQSCRLVPFGVVLAQEARRRTQNIKIMFS